jgi:hypothetical protein
MRISLSRFARIGFVLGCIFLVYYQLFGEEQYIPPDGSSLTEPKDRAAFIREAYIHGWNAYAKHAYPHDVIQPLTRGWQDNRYDFIYSDIFPIIVPS